MYRIHYLLAYFFLGLCEVLHAEDTFEQTEQRLLEKPLQGDVAFFIGQARNLRNAKPLPMDGGHIEDRVARNGHGPEHLLWTLRDSSVVKKTVPVVMGHDAAFSVERLNRLDHPDVSFTQRLSEEGSYVYRVMKSAADCSPADAAPPVLGSPSYAYVSTHQLIAAFLAFQRGCMSPEYYTRSAGLYAARVRNELLATQEQPLSDLQVERMAVLCLVKLCHELPEKLITRLHSQRSKDGMWHFQDRFTPQHMSHEHATAMANFVLVAHGFLK